MLCSLHLLSMSVAPSSRLLSLFAQMIVSSTIFIMYDKPQVRISDCMHPSPKEVFSPMEARNYRNLFSCMRKVVNLLDCLSSTIWKYPWMASSLKNNFVSGRIGSSILVLMGNG